MNQLPGPVLGISTASGAAVALVCPGAEPIQLENAQPRAHVESLVPLVGQVLQLAGLQVADLVGIGVGTGPAPYTGLRVGLVAAGALGLAAGVPVWGVSDLDVLAHQAAARLGPAKGSTILATIDAKRREVYWALFQLDAKPGESANPAWWQGTAPTKLAITEVTTPDQAPVADVVVGEGRGIGLTRLAGPEVSAPDQVPTADLVVGEAAQLYPDRLPLTPGAPTQVDPVTLAYLAAWRASQDQDTSTQPLYLRRPHVQMAQPKKKALQ